MLQCPLSDTRDYGDYPLCNALGLDVGTTPVAQSIYWWMSSSNSILDSFGGLLPCFHRIKERGLLLGIQFRELVVGQLVLPFTGAGKNYMCWMFVTTRTGKCFKQQQREFSKSRNNEVKFWTPSHRIGEVPFLVWIFRSFTQIYNNENYIFQIKSIKWSVNVV